MEVTQIHDNILTSLTEEERNATELIVPQSVTSIAPDLFLNLPNLTSITIFNPDIPVKGSWFTGCTSLTRIRIGAIPTKVFCFQDVIYEPITIEKQGDYISYYIQEFKSPNKETFFFVTKDTVYSAGKLPAEAKYLCMIASEEPNLTERYTKITLDTELSGAEYRLITRCQQTLRAWLIPYEYDLQERLTVREMVDKYKDEQGHGLFVQFVADRYRARYEAERDKVVGGDKEKARAKLLALEQFDKEQFKKANPELAKFLEEEGE